MTTQIFMIRHGQAFSNVEPIVNGMKGDEGLTPLGVQQAERLRDRLAATGEIQPDVLIASNLPRAAQTAQIIQPALGLPIVYDEEFQEFRPGEAADGMRFEEAEARFGRPDLTNNPFQPLFPGGENWGQFMLRVGTGLDRVARQYADQTIVIVCHGGVVDGSIIHFSHLNTTHLPPLAFMTNNTSITHWKLRQFRRDERFQWTLMKYNDDFHVRDLTAPQRIDWANLKQKPSEDRPPSLVPSEPSQEN